MQIINQIKDLNQSIKQDSKGKTISFFGLLSFLSVMLIRAVIRPSHFHLPPVGMFLQGTLPNFFAATGFCALAFLYHKLFFGANSNVSLAKKLLFATLFSLIGLALWEIIQYFLGFPIDYYDLLMTAAGNLVMGVFIVIMYIGDKKLT